MEATSRFRKKVEKDENYGKTIHILGERVEQIIRQNNAIDIYEEYFSEKSQTHLQQNVPR
jgi:dynein intermediate chain 2